MVTTLTIAQAVAAAPAATHLVARPSSPVAHLHVGPLTRSSRYVPLAARPVCGTRTRRLSVLDAPPLLVARRRRLCVRCSAQVAPPAATRRATASPTTDGKPSPVTRDALQASYDGLTAFDIALGAFTAETVEEVERLELLALLVVGYPACAKDPVVSPAGKQSPPVDVHIARARTRVGAAHDDTELRLHVARSAERSRLIAEQERLLTREARQRDIDVLGYTRARELEKERRRIRIVDGRDEPAAASG